MASISVLGGGVTGITTATLLQVFGHTVTIYTERRADEAYGAHDPVFASLYPAASVIPHTVTVDDPAAHLADAQAFFEVLRRDGRFGVRLQRHFEVFESPEPDPPYMAALLDAERIEGALDETGGSPSADLRCPRRPGASSLYGWQYRVYFVDIPTYYRALYSLFEALGGRFVKRTVTRDTLHEVPGDVLVNALGGRATEVFPDPAPATYLRGVLVLAESPGLPSHVDSGEHVSYNYAPDPSVYATPSGAAAGVYAYPRRDVWVLGGTRQPGRLADGTWTGEAMAGETVPIPLRGGADTTVDVPRPVLSLNRALLLGLTGVDIADLDITAVFGYRYARNLEGEGIRLEMDTAPDGRSVAHNTGHGGAGVTLSWSTALRVMRMLRDAGVATDGPLPTASDTSQPSGDADFPNRNLSTVLRRTAQRVPTDPS